MKSIFKIIPLFSIAFFSCSDQLNIYPHSAVAPESITEKDLPALRIGMYNRVQNNPPTESWILNDIMGGNLTTSTPVANDLINNTTNPLNSIVGSSWNGYYTALYQVNNVISITDGIAASSVRNRVKGEAHYFRALLHYYLVTRWGDVPVMRRNTQSLVSRDPASEAWKLIDEDLEVALSLLETSSGYYYVSKDAVTALKARVKLTEGNMPEAAALAESLITGGKYGLDGFEKIFRKAHNSEIIFAFENNTDESSNGFSNLFYTYAHPGKGSYVYRPAPSVMSMYDDTDKRKAISIDTYGGNNVINKYPGGQGSRDPFIVSRLGEMYLISAEAQGRSLGVGRLNELRAFRGLPAIFPATDNEYIDAILLERKKELLAENFSYVDLLRTGKAKEMLNLQDFQLLLPIPNTERRVNPNLSQNPGY